MALTGLPDGPKFRVFEQLQVPELAAAALTCKDIHAAVTPKLWRVYCCSACQTAVCHARDVKRDMPNLNIGDGEALCCSQTTGLVSGLNKACVDHTFLAALTDLRVTSAYCSVCGVWLGYSIANSRTRSDLAQSLTGKTLLCKSYLRRVEPNGVDQQRTSTQYTCKSPASKTHKPGTCNNLLFYGSDVLSSEHCWDAGRGIEDAFYINSLQPGTYVVENQRPLLLGQGEMVVEDTHCSVCHSNIGWKFCQDLSVNLKNDNQVNRFGVAYSSVSQPGATTN